jgi:catechol 2,3-dioxygenase-like lactoylglutathione lyase family enzyme
MIKRIWDITFTVADLKESIVFYESILGLQKKYKFKDYAGFDCSGIEIGLKTWGKMEKPRDGEPCLNFVVDDVDEAFRVLKAKGVVFTGEPKDTQWGSRAALFNDPDGHLLQITRIDWDKYLKVSAPK